MAKTICSPRSTPDRRWRSSFQPILPDPTVPGVRFFAADFLLDTPNAYLLVPNGIRCKYTTIRFTSATPEASFAKRATSRRWPSWVTPEQVPPILTQRRLQRNLLAIIHRICSGPVMACARRDALVHG